MGVRVGRLRRAFTPPQRPGRTSAPAAARTSGLASGTGSLADRIGPRPVALAGIALTSLGTLPFAYGGRHANGLLLAVALVVRGAGLSAANLAVMVGAYRDLAPDRIPHVGSTTRIVQQLGGSFGAAILGVVLQRQLTGHPGAAGTATAFGHTFAWSLALTAPALLPALFLPRRPQPPREEQHAG